jgi:hypothetical protein
LKKDNVLQGPWTKPISLDAFHHKAKKHLTVLIVERESLLYTYTLFKRGKLIQPDQFKHTITIINRIDESVQEFREMLETPEQLPEGIVSIRYLLTMALHHVEEQVKELLLFITRSPITNQRPLKQVVKERQEIQRRFELLIIGCNDIMEEYKILFDQARFQERKIANL